MIYLASPFSSTEYLVRMKRYQDVCMASAAMISSGHFVYSPIAHSYGIALHGQMRDDWKTWATHSAMMIYRSTQLWVLKLDGWEESEGIKQELILAGKAGKPITFVDPHDWRRP
jgi:Domain of unknown function (DUF1937)